jgi:hypothetical protein
MYHRADAACVAPMAAQVCKTLACMSWEPPSRRGSQVHFTAACKLNAIYPIALTLLRSQIARQLLAFRVSQVKWERVPLLPL